LIGTEIAARSSEGRSFGEFPDTYSSSALGSTAQTRFPTPSRPDTLVLGEFSKDDQSSQVSELRKPTSANG
jgi:hypothetical protein